MTTHNRPYFSLARQIATVISEKSKPTSPHAHLIDAGKTPILFVPNGSTMHRIDEVTKSHVDVLLKSGDNLHTSFELIAMGLDSNPLITDDDYPGTNVYALSLAIAQKCNMGCNYCYASQGDFGDAPQKMPLHTALQSIDFLMRDKKNGDKVQLTFLGGEPLINRADIQTATGYAYDLAEKKGVKIGFSITTNGTLLNENDARFFEEFGFAVTISLDGLKEDHDKSRPLKNGSGTYDRIITNIQPLLSMQKKMQVSARVTVTPDNTNIPVALDEFIGMGFHSVGFSPLLRSGDGQKEMNKNDLNNLLVGMIECGLKFEAAAIKGQRYPFLNMVNAFTELRKKTHRPYPCGAGAGYMSVSAGGAFSACHRFVNKPDGNMGNLQTGIDEPLQTAWLTSRHVHKQTPCSSCWARYLCGGGCHYEVIDRGRTACDYIRSWLYFAIQSYERINRLAPNWNS